jgi:drug/metabolite transporter (DMT)-like permease
MFWLIIAILAYLLFAVSSLGDEYLLNGPPNPKTYAFYVGILGIVFIFLIPFVGFSVPALPQAALAVLAGAFLILANFSYYTALDQFEISRVSPAIGGFLPIFTFSIICFLPGAGQSLGFLKILAFILLILGGVLITLERGKSLSSKSLKIAALSAFLFAIAFVLAKYVYIGQSFWSGFIWMRIGGFLVALFFLFSRPVRDEILRKRPGFQKKSGILFLGNQLFGGSAFLMQNWAVALAPLSMLPFINALEGVKYVFIVGLTFLFSAKLPVILKERISREIIFQKIAAILLIVAGLAILAL